MDIHHLKIFFEACNEKSFTKAARKLYISQSAVSIQIKKLESTLGLQLIERNSKNFKLTFAGKELFKMSQDVFEKISRMENEMKKILAEIQNGKFAQGWILENRAGRPMYNAMVKRDKEHLIEKVGQELRGMMSWLKK